ncbi:mycothiol synthase [Marinitenerispora sediminis]|uniref:Mycothiol acetyltransferase n=1 Tax=Marinitenerispora sediminis TaxID=1931232 RepID=A0A368T787_9ACTN|nr:mycothiol synthase [Marinitenerispora sediminis]RCV52997.1 mycothiol synthase [Marinitenerispora sediminis]RCV57200.1 mycothiol synthase [Marinitenerispora sediminis]RCV57243.1 mycothiol synthase [Marinitenerispora sediminis]
MTHVRITETLTADEVEAVTALAAAARDADGVGPLSEQTLLRVRHGAPAGTARFHLLYEGPEPGTGKPAGFAFAERAADPAAEPDSAELVVAPDHRYRGHGARLLRSLTEDAARGPRVWAHGRLAGAQALARAAGWSQVRGLYKMRMALRDAAGAPVSLPEPVLRGGAGDRLAIRPFEVGRDEPLWLRVNARAFADHPEQGAVTLDDLRQREAEDWFDPAGFFVAEDAAGGAFAGFHWTKVHADGAGLSDSEPVGEVYVVGVDPDWQGVGLGRALTLVGLRHLRDRGLPWVLLYVDEANRAAVRLYESLGFTLWDADVMYAPPA